VGRCGLVVGVCAVQGWGPPGTDNGGAPGCALGQNGALKVGLCGMITRFLVGGNGPLWWGVALLVLGMITALVGGLYALMEHNIPRLLAYHTLENTGILLLCLWAGVPVISLKAPVLSALGLTGGVCNLRNIILPKRLPL
uniref:proton-conducting transporter transmembrane domain-containing protein n=1 Tax=Salmonella enterica TaxID=28901 RepID=UPI00398C37C2